MDRKPQVNHSELLEPLQLHLLLYLTAQAILALRNTCKALQSLVDTASLSVVRQQCEGLLPFELHGTAADCQHLYSMDIAQAAAIAALCDGSRATLHQIPTQPNQLVQDVPAGLCAA